MMYDVARFTEIKQVQCHALMPIYVSVPPILVLVSIPALNHGIGYGYKYWYRYLVHKSGTWRLSPRNMSAMQCPRVPSMLQVVGTWFG